MRRGRVHVGLIAASGRRRGHEVLRYKVDVLPGRATPVVPGTRALAPGRYRLVLRDATGAEVARQPCAVRVMARQRS